jgi:hypothetical protein
LKKISEKRLKMFNFPRYLIVPDKVYILKIRHQSEMGRAVSRDLIDYLVEIHNPLNPLDSQELLLGLTRGLLHGYRGAIPLEWILSRFLCDSIQSNTLHLLSEKDGQVLDFKNYRKYLGREISIQETCETLVRIFQSWARGFPNEILSWREIFISAIFVSEEALKKALGAMKMNEAISEIKTGDYRVSKNLSGDINPQNA